MGNSSCGSEHEGAVLKNDIEAPTTSLGHSEFEYEDEIYIRRSSPATPQQSLREIGSPPQGFLEGCCGPTNLHKQRTFLEPVVPDNCCAARPFGKSMASADFQSWSPETEEQLDISCLKDGLPNGYHMESFPQGDCFQEKLNECKLAEKKQGCRWDVVRATTMVLAICTTIFASSVFQSLLDGDAFPGTPSFESTMRYGSIPIIAAIIGYSTNVLAIEMMFYPLEFIGCFPQLKIGLGLDLYLCGWQGVIPMKAQEMAEISVDMITKKLIKIDEIFSRLDPEICGDLVAPKMPAVISSVMQSAGREHCPKLWELLPVSVRSQLEQNVTADAKHMMSEFIRELRSNITDVFDLKTCVVDCMVNNRQMLVDMFQKCGATEFEFIRVSGFYLGFSFGLLQMTMWVFVKMWWILPLCGLFVGYFTNVIALKVIFLPVEKRKVCGITVQGLFLQRQNEVAALYAKQVANTVLSADVLMNALITGPKSDSVYDLLDAHVANNVEAQAAMYKHAFMMVAGTESWINFREGMCTEFRKKVPMLLQCIEKYAQEAMELEITLRTRMEKLPSPEFERLLHAVFEQDEFKLILVGALLGAIVGFIQAVVQTPEQLGINL